MIYRSIGHNFRPVDLFLAFWPPLIDAVCSLFNGQTRRLDEQRDIQYCVCMSLRVRGRKEGGPVRSDTLEEMERYTHPVWCRPESKRPPPLRVAYRARVA